MVGLRQKKLFIRAMLMGTQYRKILCLAAMASSRGKRAIHSTKTTLLKSAGARGQHRCNIRLSGWTQINIKERNREQSVIMCVIVGDVLNGGYMLLFTQEYACLLISTKPVDMPEDSPQTPQHPTKVASRPGRTWGT